MICAKWRKVERKGWHEKGTKETNTLFSKRCKKKMCREMKKYVRKRWKRNRVRQKATGFFFPFCLFLTRVPTLSTDDNSWHSTLPVLGDGENRDLQCWRCCCCGSDGLQVDMAQSVRSVWEGTGMVHGVDASNECHGRMGVSGDNRHKTQEDRTDRMGECVVIRGALSKPGFLTTACEASSCIHRPCGNPSCQIGHRLSILCLHAPRLPAPDLSFPSARSCMMKD